MLLRKFIGDFVCFYLLIVNVPCGEAGSLSFAIDDTGSMQDDITHVTRGAEAIMKLVFAKKSDINELVLVTFNDPGVQLRTKNSSQHTFLNDLKRIRPNGGGDCPEMALTGIEEALKASSSGSYIYVFTDANAKDYNKLNIIQSLCQKKQSQVMIVYSHDKNCFDPRGVQFNVYYDIAKACSGQVFIVQKNEVNSLLKTIETLLQGKHSIMKWTMVPSTTSYVPVQFTLDEKAKYAIVSTSAVNVNLRITRSNYFNGPQVNFEKTMWNRNGKVVKLIDPVPGNYYAWVKGGTSITVMVYGRTDFTFDYGFSILEPKLLAETSKQPKAGLKQHVSINVTDPDNSVNIQTVQILDITNNENIIYELPLRNIGKGFYITEGFVSPAYTFRIAVKGEIKMSKNTITRISKNIDPQIVDIIPESVPDVKIDEGMTIDVNYGAGVSLTCKVTAHPAPKIEWYTSSGVILPSQSSVIDDPQFVSYLKLENMKQSETYVCKASNKNGVGKDTRIQVNVRPIFTKISEVSVASIVRYGEDVKLLCNIKSYLPITIKWYRYGKQLYGNSGKYSISSDESVLTLTSMDLDMQGNYTCEATLNSDPKIKQIYVNDVKISGLGCYITKNIATRNQPLVTQIDTPTWPTYMGNSYLLIKGNEEIKLSCPNTRTSTNTFSILPGRKEIIAKCDDQDKFFVEGKLYRYSDLQCNIKVEPSVKRTGNQCSGPNSEMIRVGFEVNGFIEAYKVCYDKSLNVPIYASASTSIVKSGDRVDSFNIEWSSAPELGNRTIGNWNPEGSCKCCYTQGQLLNSKELAFGPAQAATFIDNLNSIPIWNPSCDGSERTSWQTFDNAIRDISATNGKWKFWTGASEYALKDGGLVPRYLWKVINYGADSTVMVYVNDKYPVESDIRCSRPCQSMMKGDKYLYCCTPEEFKSAFGYNDSCLLQKHIPHHIRVSIVVFMWC